MKAFVIKNKDGEYLRGIYGKNGEYCWTKDIIDAMTYGFNEFMPQPIENCMLVPITISEGDIEEENRVLKSNLYEIWHSFATICEVCVSESKYEISSENAVEEIRNYLTDIDLCFDEIEEKLGTDYFIEQAKGE